MRPCSRFRRTASWPVSAAIFRKPTLPCYWARGDDCAVLKAGRPLCVSSDLFLEDSALSPPLFHGRRHRAQGPCREHQRPGRLRRPPPGFHAQPGAARLGGHGLAESFFKGMAALAGNSAWPCGGDLSRCECLHVSVTVWGEAADPGGFLVRGGSMPATVFLWWAAWGLRGSAFRCWKNTAAPRLRTGPRPAPRICALILRWTRA